MKKKNLSLMCAAMLAATAIPANFAMADETKDAENLTEWAMDEPVTLTVLKNQNPATVNYADGEDIRLMPAMAMPTKVMDTSMLVEAKTS